MSKNERLFFELALFRLFKLPCNPFSTFCISPRMNEEAQQESSSTSDNNLSTLSPVNKEETNQQISSKQYTSMFSTNCIGPPPPFPIVHYWHESCLNCATCGYSLVGNGQCFMKNYDPSNQLYCRSDYQALRILIT